MPIYFFHMTEGDLFIPDLEGSDRPDLEAVCRMAAEGAGALIGEAVGKGRRDYEGRFDVEDAGGQRVLTLHFACPVRLDIAARSDDASLP